ncbi:MAG TPA: choice-of-anchor V domain-containing protein [Chitinophagaceae bacterium]|nr:choice-of-anchor V domain-containing protein [Chitinophagaceae bacterium]
MKKKFLLFSATLGIAYLGLTAYSSGPAGSSLNRTGSDGAAASCAGGGCHSASGTTTTGMFTLTDKATSTVVSSGKYVPGKTYVVRLSGANTSGLNKFGFQATVTKADKSLTGTLTTTATHTISRTVGSTKIVEHTAVLSATGSALTVDFEWTAPAKGAGTATFYGIINAVNGTGNVAGDEPSMGFTAAFTEDVTSSIGASATALQTAIYPNPCSDVLHIEAQGNITVSISDLGGRQLISTSAQKDIDVSALQPGSYIIRLDNGTEKQVSMFIKK